MLRLFSRLLDNEDLGLPLTQALLRGIGPLQTEEERFRTAEQLSNAVYPEFRFPDFGRYFLRDPEFNSYYRRFMDPRNWHSYDRKFALDQFLKISVAVDGDLAECGTYKGASAWLMCKRAEGTGKIVHLFDSFEGLSEPKEVDGSWWQKGSLTAGEEFLRQNLAEFDNYRSYAGWIPARFSDIGDRRFCFLHVDVDLYQPTLDSLGFFYPRMNSGGVLIFDDYGYTTCPGARRAIDEFFSDKPEPVLELPTGQGFVLTGSRKRSALSLRDRTR